MGKPEFQRVRTGRPLRGAPPRPALDVGRRSELDDGADHLAGLHGTEGIVHIVDFDATADHALEVQLALAEAHAEVAQVRAEAVAEKAIASAPKVVMKCLDKDRAVTTKVDAKGRTTMYVCESYGDTVALKALKHTRESLAADRNWSDEMRAEILADIDAEIERLSR